MPWVQVLLEGLLGTTWRDGGWGFEGATRGGPQATGLSWHWRAEWRDAKRFDDSHWGYAVGIAVSGAPPEDPAMVQFLLVTRPRSASLSPDLVDVGNKDTHWGWAAGPWSDSSLVPVALLARRVSGTPSMHKHRAKPLRTSGLRGKMKLD